ncbi:MAG: hypothetical protein AAGA85_22380 [Bacteroidota bacterium]
MNWLLLLALHSQNFRQSQRPVNKHMPNMGVLTYWKAVGASAPLIYKAAFEDLSKDIDASDSNLFLACSEALFMRSPSWLARV